MSIYLTFIALQAILLSLVKSSIVPTSEIKLYPNTEGSPSLYMISFQANQYMQNDEYMLVLLDWLEDPIDPHSCIFVNSSKQIECTDLDSPDPDFDLAFTTDAIAIHNDQIDPARTLVVLLKDGIDADTEYFFEFALYNQV